MKTKSKDILLGFTETRIAKDGLEYFRKNGIECCLDELARVDMNGESLTIYAMKIMATLRSCEVIIAWCNEQLKFPENEEFKLVFIYIKSMVMQASLTVDDD